MRFMNFAVSDGDGDVLNIMEIVQNFSGLFIGDWRTCTACILVECLVFI